MQYIKPPVNNINIIFLLLNIPVEIDNNNIALNHPKEPLMPEPNHRPSYLPIHFATSETQLAAHLIHIRLPTLSTPAPPIDTEKTRKANKYTARIPYTVAPLSIAGDKFTCSSDKIGHTHAQQRALRCFFPSTLYTRAVCVLYLYR